MLLSDARVGIEVRFIPNHAHGDLDHADCEDGRISSFNDKYIFVRFHKTVAKLGWDGTTSQACSPGDLVCMGAR